jgi:glycosyltransferase involved in cell wall biosynthesis
MKILIISSTLPVAGGVTTYTNKLSELLIDNNNEVKMITVLSNKNTGFPIINNFAAKIIKLLTKFDFIFILMIYFSRIIIYLRTLLLLNKYTPDIFHVQDINSANAIKSICKKKGIGLILTVHSHLFNAETSSRIIKKDSILGKILLLEEIKAYKTVDKNIVLSKYHSTLLKSFKIENDRIQYIQNFVDTNQFKPVEQETKKSLRRQFGLNNNDFIITYVGRFIESKGIKYILEAFKELSHYKDIKLTMAGYGELDDYIKQFISKNKLNNIRLLGHLNHSEIAIPYSLSDAFIITSLNMEGSPMTVFEAMSCGLPVISTRVGGLKDILNKAEFSIIIGEADTNQIINAILNLYNNKDLYTKLSSNSLKCVQDNFSISKYYKKIIDVYRSTS